ncbi:hypothetical protein GALMADRAFT_276828 [Galerina marginata CBS 339.88]|uniref:Uncharacterized protein n=1 Tax=Galerina marginata (strain CBS 339.88) TaxID=685588 RepID=A0A067TE13_GALM3|nr:hypothetical protein GALMADRAFT_276828 [Galerina marginata CBS 339.88]
MEQLRGAPRRATITSASKRLAQAEQAAKTIELALKQKNEMANDLQKRVELTRQCSQLTKELVVTLGKVGEAKKRLTLVTEKADRLDAKLQSLHEETNGFEFGYQKSKKDYSELVIELEHLGIN